MVSINSLSPCTFDVVENKNKEVLTRIQEIVSPFVSTISRLSKSIFIPLEEPSWHGALTKTGLGLIGFLGLNQLSNDLKMDFKFDLIGNCVSTGLLMTGVREACYLVYSKIMYPPLPQNEENIGRVEKHNRIINRKNNDLARLIKLVKIVAFSCISLNCLYNYDTLGHVSFLNTRPDSSTYRVLNSIGNTDFSLSVFQAAICIANLFINFHEIKDFNQDSFLRDRPIFEIVNTAVLAIFFSQIGGLNPKARPYHECVIKKLNSNTDFMTADIQGKWKFIKEWKNSCINLLPKGDEGKRVYYEYRKTLYINFEEDNLKYSSQFDASVKVPSYVTNNNIYVFYAKTCVKLYSKIVLLGN
ncbi:MAG: hypothetical protein H0U49_06315, partial [Parachlamydiaceae bacterium]|nr:hypothetical protein [Parachlamydiaceae bacterium]